MKPKMFQTLLILVLSLMPLCTLRAEQTTTPLTTTAHVTLANVDNQITLVGKVLNWRPATKPAAPNSFYLQDAAGQVRVCIWSDALLKVANIHKMGNGVNVKVTGTIKNYMGKAEVQVKEPRWFLIGDAATAAPAAPATATNAKSTTAPTAMKIKAITSGLVGEYVTVQGTVGGVRDSKNTKVPWIINLTDDSEVGIDAVFWLDTPPDAAVKMPAKGEKWVVTGTINEFRERLQIKTEFPTGWTKK